MSQRSKLRAQAQSSLRAARIALTPSRRTLLIGLATLISSSSLFAQKDPPLAIQVWKDPHCGCCKDWIAHLEKSGFTATILDQGNNAIRNQLGMPAKFGSCHTALIQGYVIEGHVPASEILTLYLKIMPWRWLSLPGTKAWLPTTSPLICSSPPLVV
ncbi:MAG: DUF411 domain-containing protein [Betaproteobacteria bacterium]|nr:DUF411 domain-containing protein [Betaproteobacteria bacterium]